MQITNRFAMLGVIIGNAELALRENSEGNPIDEYLREILPEDDQSDARAPGPHGAGGVYRG